MKLGLVLEGGGLRGAYTAGVMTWLIDNKVMVDYGAGISSGAQYLCNYMIGDTRQIKNISVKLSAQYFDKGLKPLLREGNLVGYDKLFDYVLKEVEPLDLNRLRASSVEGEFGVYDLTDCETKWYDIKAIDDDLKLLKAACTLPFFSKAVKYQGRKLLDGGITNMIPIHHSIKAGCDKHIVVSTKPLNYVRKPQNWIVKAGLFAAYPKYPKMRKDLSFRAQRYHQEVDLVKSLEAEGKALRLNPSRDTGISRFGGDIDKLEELYQLGYQDCESRREEIFAFIKK